ncbi:MAG TPA: Fic family protein [Candidatus Saccharimonadia bacterium]|nr:Fic family protein [Candidatus Saccharimonadia bacterium]
MNLSPRQSIIIKKLFVKSSGTADLLKHMSDDGLNISEDTLQRDLKYLSNNKLLISKGSGPSRIHELATLGRLYVSWSEEEVKSFLQDENRSPSKYIPDVVDNLKNSLKDNIFTDQETHVVDRYRQFILSLDSNLASKWKQKWLIEFAWKSSSIEGNTYSVLETETLLVDHVEATGKSHQEAVMIVNHQKAYDFITQNTTDFKTISLDKILKIHELLVKDLNVVFGIRSAPVRITGSRYIPPNNFQQLSENLKKIIRAINEINDPLSKALSCLLLIAYLQPFGDGNKRTSRVLANAILESHNYPPLTLSGIEPTEYRRACISFYELTDIKPMVDIIKSSYQRFLEF